MNSMQKFILKLKFKLMILKMRIKPPKTEVDNSKGYIYEEDED
jgi:hypothetical protein